MNRPGNGDDLYTVRLALCRYVDMRCAQRIVAQARRVPSVAAVRADVAGHQITFWLRRPTEESLICLIEAFSSMGWRVAAANLQAGWIGSPAGSCRANDSKRACGKNYMQHIQQAIWCEFVPYAQVGEHLAELAAARLSLHLHVRPADVGSDELARLLTEAHGAGVEVKLWLLLEEEGGLVYCSRYALTKYATHARRVAQWLREADLPVCWLVFDCEPPPWYGRVVFAHMQRREYIKLWRFAREQADPAAFVRAAAQLAALVSDLQDDGFKVLGATVRPVIEGLIHRSLLAQDVLGVPFSMIPWDRVSFLVYRYDLKQSDYLAWVHRYACACRQHFGERGALDLGMIGGESILDGHLDRWGESEEMMLRFLRHIAQPKDVRAAVAQAERCGLAHVQLYSLDGALSSQIALHEWLRVAKTIEPRASRRTYMSAALTGGILYRLFRIVMGGDGPVLRKLPLVAPEFRSATT